MRISVFYKNIVFKLYHLQMTKGRIYVHRAERSGKAMYLQKEINRFHKTQKAKRTLPNRRALYEEELITDAVYIKQAATERASYHPTQKPVDLGRYLIRALIPIRERIVLDERALAGAVVF